MGRGHVCGLVLSRHQGYVGRRHCVGSGHLQGQGVWVGGGLCKVSLSKKRVVWAWGGGCGIVVFWERDVGRASVCGVATPRGLCGWGSPPEGKVGVGRQCAGKAVTTRRAVYSTVCR